MVSSGSDIKAHLSSISDRDEATWSRTEISEVAQRPTISRQKGKDCQKRSRERNLHPTQKGTARSWREKSVPGNTCGNESWVAAAAAVGRTAVEAEVAVRSSACRGSKEVSAPPSSHDERFFLFVQKKKKTYHRRRPLLNTFYPHLSEKCSVN